MLGCSGRDVATPATLRNLFLAVTALLALGVVRVAAGPTASVVSGSATIRARAARGDRQPVEQQRDHQLETFNFGVTERVNQPSSSSVALNRVTVIGPMLGAPTADVPDPATCIRVQLGRGGGSRRLSRH